MWGCNEIEVSKKNFILIRKLCITFRVVKWRTKKIGVPSRDIAISRSGMFNTKTRRAIFFVTIWGSLLPSPWLNFPSPRPLLILTVSHPQVEGLNRTHAQCISTRLQLVPSHWQYPSLIDSDRGYLASSQDPLRGFQSREGIGAIAVLTPWGIRVNSKPSLSLPLNILGPISDWRSGDTCGPSYVQPAQLITGTCWDVSILLCEMFNWN
jgi:hypothetical protein